MIFSAMDFEVQPRWSSHPIIDAFAYAHSFVQTPQRSEVSFGAVTLALRILGAVTLHDSQPCRCGPTAYQWVP